MNKSKYNRTTVVNSQYTNFPTTRFQSELLDEHQKRLYHQQRRMSEYKGLNQRKKNKHNANLYPTFVRRNVERNDHEGYQSLGGFYSPPKSKTVKSHLVSSIRTEEQALRYLEFKDKILQALMSNAIYKEKDITELFAKYLEENQDLNAKVLEEILQQLDQELELKRKQNGSRKMAQ